MCKIILSLCQVPNIYSVIYKHVFFPTRILKQRQSQNACNARLRMPAGAVLLHPRLHGLW